MLDSNDLEEDTRALYHMEDEWLYADEATPVMGSCEGDSTEKEQAADEWWKDCYPNVADRAIPFIKNVTVHDTDDLMSYRDSLFNALGHLAEGGSVMDQQLPLVALEEEKQRNAGRA